MAENPRTKHIFEWFWKPSLIGYKIPVSFNVMSREQEYSRSFSFIFRDIKRRKLPDCRLEKLEMWDAQTSHLGQVVQIFFWRTISIQTHQIRLVYATCSFNLYCMNFICALYGLFYRLLKTRTGNYKWQKTPVPSIFLNDFESQA
jgi:hypothetical protein